MRIALVGPVYPYRGGIAHHTALLARHLRERHDVQLTSFRRQYPRWLISGRSDRDPSLLPLDVAARYLLDPLNPVTWWQVARRWRAWQPDAVIIPWWVTFWAPAWLSLTELAHGWTRAQVIYLCHNVLPHEAGMFDRHVARFVLSRGDAVIVQAQAQMDLVHQLLPGKRAACTPHPSYAEVGCVGPAASMSNAVSARLQLNLPPVGQPVLLYFGFIRPYKGLQVLLDALPDVLAHIPAHLLIVGEFWEPRAAYDAHIARLGLNQRVTIIDRYVADEQLPLFFAAADVAVLPYLSATQSGVVQLAFGHGLPVIATRTGGLLDAVQDDSTGLLVPPGDPASLAQAIVKYFEEDMGPGMRANIGRIAERFDWHHMVATIEDLGQRRG